MGYETVTKFIENLQKELTDINCIGYNVLYGGVAYAVIDNTGLDNAIENLVRMLPLGSPMQQQTAANALTYGLARVTQKAMEDAME